MTKLRIADGLSLPLEATTQAIGVLAKRRAGKSYTARRLAEQLLHAGQQIVIVDPKGDWWGIRSGADGKSPGFPVVILGGERGDVPLEASGGEIVAKLVVEERVSVLLDLSLFRKHEVTTFMTAFLENLYRLKAREVYRTPVMLIVDEADAIMPQKPQKGEERMLGAGEDIVRRGGQRGIGCMLITQRTAVLNKNVLTQVQLLVALRTIAPQDLKAMDDWIDVHGTREQRETLMASLPALPTGDAWFWSPGWPTTDGIFKHVHVLPIETFDSGATPKSGEKRVEPKNLADVDLGALTRQMAATIEKAKADDPKELRKEIARLKSELTKKQPAVADPKAIEQAVARERARIMREAHAERDAFITAAGRHIRTFEKFAGELEAQGRWVLDAAVRFKNSLPNGGERYGGAIASVDVVPAEPRTAPVVRRVERAVPIRSTSNGDGSFPKGEKVILTAIAQHTDGATRAQLRAITGLKRSTVDAYVQRLSGKEFVEVGDLIRATPAGIDALGDFEPLPTGNALRDHWLTAGQLPDGERKVLSILAEAYPDAVQREAIDEQAGYARSSRDAYIQRLSARKLITVGRDGVRMSENLDG